MNRYPLPLTHKAYTFAILIAMVPVLASMSFAATLSPTGRDSGYWVFAVFAGLGLGVWGGPKLARQLMGETAIVDPETRTVRIGTRTLPFAEITKVALELDERHDRRLGLVLFASIAVFTRDQRIVFVSREKRPSQRKAVEQELTPVAQSLARSLGRQLD